MGRINFEHVQKYLRLKAYGILTEVIRQHSVEYLRKGVSPFERLKPASLKERKPAKPLLDVGSRVIYPTLQLTLYFPCPSFPVHQLADMHHLHRQVIAFYPIPQLNQASGTGCHHNLCSGIFDILHLFVLNRQADIPMGDGKSAAQTAAIVGPFHFHIFHTFNRA